MKYDEGKPDYTLIPPQILDAIWEVRKYGTQKYGSVNNWKTVSVERYWQAVLRHVRAAWDDPTRKDPESGLPHLWHIACNIAFLLELENDLSDPAR